MPDIQMRFHGDMLVLSGSLRNTLARGGYDVEQGIEQLDLFEEEAVEQALRMQMAAGPQCLCTPTLAITQAQLAHERMRDRQQEVVNAALALCGRFRPQHLLAQIGPTRLPLDASSAASLVANRDQYAQAVGAFGDGGVDGFFFDGLLSVDDVRCALMGARKMTAAAVMVSVNVDEEGNLEGRRSPVEEMVAVACDLQADVVGVRSGAAPETIAHIVERIADTCDLPILVQLAVLEENRRTPLDASDAPYWHPDAMIAAAGRLRAAGAQFLRAVGEASASYTGALAAATAGLPAVR